MPTEVIEFLTQAVKDAEAHYNKAKALWDRTQPRTKKSQRYPQIDDALLYAEDMLAEAQSKLGAAIASRHTPDGFKISHTTRDPLSCAIKAQEHEIIDQSGLDYVIFTKPVTHGYVSPKDSLPIPFAAFKDSIIAANFVTMCDLDNYEIRHNGKVIEAHASSSDNRYEGIIIREPRKG